MKHRKKIPALLLFFALMAGCSDHAHAHKIMMYADPEGPQVVGAARSAAGTPVANATVTVRDATGKILLTTTTDKEGAFRFSAPVRADLFLSVDAGEGHAAKCKIFAIDLPETLPNTERSNVVESGGPAQASDAAQENNPVHSAAHSGEALRQMLGAVVSERIRPLNRRIEALESATQWRDILGSIGIIFGIFGVAFYLLARNKKPPAA